VGRSFALLAALALGAISCSSGDPSSTATGRPTSVTDPRFTEVSAYGVSAEVPGDWVATPADDAAFAIGVSASPGPGRLVPGEQGLVATRVDATQVGAPSDLYYLAAKGPVMARIRANHRCTVTAQHVYADHAPTAITVEFRHVQGERGLGAPGRGVGRGGGNGEVAQATVFRTATVSPSQGSMPGRHIPCCPRSESR